MAKYSERSIDFAARLGQAPRQLATGSKHRLESKRCHLHTVVSGIAFKEVSRRPAATVLRWPMGFSIVRL
mgnify:CR=1 FL=1